MTLLRSTATADQRLEFLQEVSGRLFDLKAAVEEFNGPQATDGTMLEWMIRAAYQEARRDEETAKQMVKDGPPTRDEMFTDG